MNSYFYMTQNKTAYLHKSIHYNTVKTIYNVTIKENTLAAAQGKIPYKVLVKLQACSCNITKNELSLVLHWYLSKISFTFYEHPT